MRFRRKRSDPQAATGEQPEAAGDEDEPVPTHARADGPWDSAEISLDEAERALVDLGGLVIAAKEGLELQLQVDEASGQVVAVLLVDAEGAVELRPFAAPRGAEGSAGIWDDVRKAIAAEAAQHGGTVTEVDGAYGTELVVDMPVTTADDKTATQLSRVVGIRGPRWLLRATYVGRPAAAPDPEGDLEKVVRSVVVVRGGAPMAPGEPIPLSLPGNAHLLPPP